MTGYCDKDDILPFHSLPFTSYCVLCVCIVVDGESFVILFYSEVIFYVDASCQAAIRLGHSVRLKLFDDVINISSHWAKSSVK